MKAGQQSGTGAMTNLDDEKVRKNDILSNRDKAQRRPGQSLDSNGVQVEEYKDIPTNQRPDAADASKASAPRQNEEDETADKTADKKVDRPGFDLGGADGDTTAGSGLGLGTDAFEDRKARRLPR